MSSPSSNGNCDEPIAPSLFSGIPAFRSNSFLGRASAAAQNQTFVPNNVACEGVNAGQTAWQLAQPSALRQAESYLQAYGGSIARYVPGMLLSASQIQREVQQLPLRRSTRVAPPQAQKRSRVDADAPAPALKRRVVEPVISPPPSTHTVRWQPDQQPESSESIDVWNSDARRGSTPSNRSDVDS